MRLDTDDPIREFDDDKLSFERLARGLARELVAYDRPNSFAIGINGAWGSGKTSLLNLTQKAIEEAKAHDPQAARVILIPFSTWIVENREALLRQLLPVIEKRIREEFLLSDEELGLRKALGALRRYSAAVKGVERGLSLTTATATLFSMPVAPWLAPLTTTLGELLKMIGLRDGHVPTLDELRAAAQHALIEAGIRVVVVLDDLDRLEPKEILEVARLVRSTLDLPHVAFLVSYDREHAAQCIRYELGINGEEYLEKIIQLPLGVPAVDSYDLARLFASRLEPVLGEELSGEEAQRASIAIWRDLRSLFLKTPRDVARILNSVSFGWAMLKSEVDSGDLIFVSALRTKAPNVYLWLVEYLQAFFRDAARRINSDELRATFDRKLALAAKADDLSEDALRESFTRYLPGVESFSIGKPDGTLFKDQKDVAQASTNRRLASEQHWANYLDLIPARSGFTDAWFRMVVARAIDDPAAVSRELVILSTDVFPSGGTSADRFLDRLRAEAGSGKLTGAQCGAMARVIADSADTLIANSPPEGFLEGRLDLRLEGVVRALLKVLPTHDADELFGDLLAQGRSLSWLMYLLRSQLFAHGRIGDRPRDERKIVTERGLDDAEKIARSRIRQAATDGTLRQLDNLIFVVLAWRDIQEKPDEVNVWFVGETASNKDFVEVLRKLKQRVQSSSGDYWRIEPAVAEAVQSVSVIKERLRILKLDDSVSEQAQEVLQMLENEF